MWRQSPRIFSTPIYYYEMSGQMKTLADMKAKGIIRRIGANRNGYWEITDE